MSPIDDELRALLSDRASAVPPAPDPLGGIERRAKRMRRNRVAASVAGTALVVSAIALALPTLRPDNGGGTTQVAATPSPAVSIEASPTAAPARASMLDPEHPWPYRGLEKLVVPTELASLQAEWSAKHPGSTLRPLYGHVYEPSNQEEIVVVSSLPYRWGVATSSEAGWQFDVDNELPARATVLMTPLPGDEAPRLLILAAPSTGDMSYAKDGTSFRTVVGSDPGVAFVPLEGDTSHDMVRVLDGDGDEDHPVFRGPAPDADSQVTGTDGRPANYLNWQTRGTVDRRLEDQAVAAYAEAKGSRDIALVGHHVLWGGRDADGRGLLFMEAWLGGGDAETFGMVSTGERFLGPVLAQDPHVLAYLAAGAPGSRFDPLLLLPRPGSGPFYYATSATAGYGQVGNARSDVENFSLIDRDPKATSDRVKVLDGDGMKVLYDGAVQPLLCGATSCG